MISEFKIRVDFELAMQNPVNDLLLANTLDACISQALEKWLEERRCLCSIPTVTVMRQSKGLT